jgi:acyl-CoA thioesterase
VQGDSSSRRPGAVGIFDRDTAVKRIDGDRLEQGAGSSGGSAGGALADPRSPAIAGLARATFSAEVAPGWRAGRGPHGGYLAAMLLRALTETVADPARSPRSLTIHYARAPEPGPVRIHTAIERAGRSLSTLSARMERDGSVIALALAAFSVPWSAPEITDLGLPAVAPPQPPRAADPSFLGAPPFTRHLVIQPRIGALPFSGSDQPMETGAWLGLAEPRPIDPLSLAFFSDALFPTPFIRLSEPAPAPTIDLTVHFRTPMPRVEDPDPRELCLVRFRSRLIHEGFFEEDGVIWARDGAVLAHSRQLALVMGRVAPHEDRPAS